MEEQIEQLHGALNKPNGIFLVTRTHSGKSSTLYALMSRLNAPDTKTLMVEAPIDDVIPHTLLEAITHISLGGEFHALSFAKQFPELEDLQGLAG